MPGRLNVLADNLSRRNQILPTEWSIAQEALLKVWFRWGKPQIDLFATRLNYKLPKFVSPVKDPLAWKIDAFAMNWENLHCYAYPPNQSHSENTCENHSGKVQDDSHHTVLARGNLVPRSNGSGDPRPPISESKPKSTNTTNIRGSSSKPCPTQPSRVATIRSKLLKKGYSVKAVSLALKAKRQSSCKNYSYKWKVWTVFCDSFKPRPIDPLHPKVSHFIEFITFLHEVKHFSYRTILNYRSAIANTIGSAIGIQTSYLVSNPDVIQVIQGIRSLRQRASSVYCLFQIFFCFFVYRIEVMATIEKLVKAFEGLKVFQPGAAGSEDQSK